MPHLTQLGSSHATLLLPGAASALTSALVSSYSSRSNLFDSRSTNVEGLTSSGSEFGLHESG